jgi:hypothetical protein
MNLETPNKDINQESDSVSENKPKIDQNITSSIDPSIQSNSSSKSKSKSKQMTEKQETDRLIRQLEKDEREYRKAKNRAFYKSAAFRRTYTWQLMEEEREARGLPRDPRKRIRVRQSADRAGHLLWTKF